MLYSSKMNSFRSHLFQFCSWQRCLLKVTEFFDDAFDRRVLEVGGVVLASLQAILQGVSRHFQVFLKLENNKHLVIKTEE